MDIILTGTLNAVEGSFLATAPMGIANELDRSIKYPQGGPRTARLPRVPMPLDDGTGEMAWSAYLPGASLRGGLRRMALSALYALQAPRMDLDELRYLAIGGVSGSGSAPDFDLLKAQVLRERLPLVGLFGAGPDLGQQWTAGTLAVGDACPHAPLSPPIRTGVRADVIGGSRTDSIEFLSPEAAQGLLDRAQNERIAAGLRRAVKELEKSQRAAKRTKDAKAVADIDAELAAKKGALEKLDAGDVSPQMPLDGYEYIPARLALTQRMWLRGSSDAELGLLAAALNAWSQEPVIGAHFAHGGGVFEAHWSVRGRAEASAPYEDWGQIVFVPYEECRFEGPISKRVKVGLEALRAHCQAWKGQSVRDVLASTPA